MAVVITIFTLFGSLCGIIVILIRKIPVLAELPVDNTKKTGFLEKIKNKMGDRKILNGFSSEILLQKLLSKIRITTLKIENKTSNWLSKLRQKSLEKKNFSDNYWQKIIKRKK